MRRIGTVALMMVLLVAAIARGEGCSTSPPPNNVINLSAAQSTIDTFTFVNPMAGKAVVKDSAQVSWLTEPQLLNGTTADATSNGRFPLTLGYCKTDGGGNPTIEFPTLGITQQKLVETPAFAVQYVPTEATNGHPFVRYLRFSWLESASGAAGQAAKPDEKDPAKQDKRQSVTYKVSAIAGVPDFASDSRYKVWAYTGYTYLRSAKDFKDSFPELLVRVETRWLDAFVAMKRYRPEIYQEILDTGTHCDERLATQKELGKVAVTIHDHVKATQDDVKDGRATVVGQLIPVTSRDVYAGRQLSDGDVVRTCGIPRLWATRIYGEAGLVGTTAVATDNKGTTVIGGVTQSFGGTFGIAPIGWTRIVSRAKPSDTGQFTILFPLRLGIVSIPAKLDQDGNPVKDEKGNDVTGRTAFNYSANVRIENEVGSGNFEGAYFELGFGESENFSRKKYPRIRADALLPIGGNSTLFRFATRLQIDAPRPLARRKEDVPDNLASEIRISLLFNVDLLELGRRMSGR